MIEKLNTEQIEELLQDNVWGHLGCSDSFNTYVYPINYLYDGKYVTCQSQQGFKVIVMRQNNRVCLQVDEVQSHKNWKSVIVLGEYQELKDEQEYNDAMKAFADRRLFMKMRESPIIPLSNDLDAETTSKVDIKPVIFRVMIDEKNGRCENE